MARTYRCGARPFVRTVVEEEVTMHRTHLLGPLFAVILLAVTGAEADATYGIETTV